ncbi:MAG: acetate--CoA ligase family protein, partial [Chloroflexota bacterium]
LLLGVRGEARKDIDEVASAIIKIGWILKKTNAISDIEVNPLVVYDRGEGVKAVDVRILLRESEEA